MNMKMNCLRKGRTLALLVGILMITFPTAGLAISDRAGTASAVFLRMDVGPRYVALGGAGTASVNYPYAMYFNAGALTASEGTQISFQHNEYFQDLNQEYLAATYALSDRSTLGLSLNYLDMGDIPRTIELSSGVYGGQVGEFTANDLAFSVAYGREITDSLSAGIGIKYVRSKIDSYSASTVAGDVGVLYKTDIRGLTLGAAVNNMGPGLKFVRERYKLPTLYRAGAAYEFWNDRLMLTADLLKPVDNDFGVGAGLEWRVLGTKSDYGLDLRLGYNSLKTDADDGLSLGAGFRLSEFKLDYAYMPFGDLGDAHRFGVTYRFR